MQVNPIKNTIPGKNIRLYAWILLVAITALSVVQAAKLVHRNGCVDLRCRTVGARLLGTPWSPYFYKWKPEDGVFFLDPNDKPNRTVNGNVVTPAVLRLLYPFSSLPYGIIKPAWVVLQYGFLFASLWLLCRTSGAVQKNNMRATVFTGLTFLCSTVWFYNIERGQLYTFYLFLLSLICGLNVSGWKYGRFFSGFINALAVFLRPLMGVLLLVVVVKPDRKFLAGAVCGAIAGLLLFVLPLRVQWQDYFAAMKMYSEVAAAAVDSTAAAPMPAEIEGQLNLQKYTTFDCGGLTTVQYYLATRGIHTGSAVLGALFLMVAAASYLLWRAVKPRIVAADQLYLFAFFLYVMAELFIIGYRGGYNQIEWVFAIFLICSKKKVSVFLIAVILLAVVLQNISLHLLSHQFELAEIILISVLFYEACGRGERKNWQVNATP